jgi:hypothetical protein
MKAGSAFAAFLSKGTTLTLPRGAGLARSRAAIAAAAFGVAFVAGAAHAQTSAAGPNVPGQVRVIAQSSVPPYAAPDAVKPARSSAPAAQSPVAQAPAAARPAAPAPAAPSSNPSFQGRPQAAAPAPAAPAARGSGNWPQAQQQTAQGRPHDHDRRDRNSFGSAPFALGAVLGAALGQPAAVYGAPAAYPPVAVVGAPVYGDPGYDQGGYAPPPQAYPSAGPGYRAENARDPGFPRDYSVAGGTRNMPQTLNIGGEQLDTQTVFASIAAARIAGVTPAALLALQSRSAEAVEAMRQKAGEDDPNAPIEGPYAYSIERWQADAARFGNSVGLAGAMAKITGGSNGNAEEDRASLNSMRGEPYVASLMAASAMAANDAAYRQTFGAGPVMAMLVVGHHAGRQAMLKLAQIARQDPNVPMAAVIKPEYLRDLVMLTGLAHMQPPGGFTVGSYIGALDNALKNALTRYASVDRMALPPDYKPLDRATANAEREPAAAAPRF